MTQQAYDHLSIEGDPFGIREFSCLPKLPHPAILEMSSIARRKKSSSCWRGYVAHWSITGQSLFLNDIECFYFFAQEEPLFANWVTSVLQLPIGRIDPDLGSIHDQICEAYIELDVVAGIVTRWRVNKWQPFTARKINGPPWQEGFFWIEARELVRAHGYKFRFEMTEEESHPGRLWQQLKEHGFMQGYLTRTMIAKFIPLDQWDANSFFGAKTLRSFLDRHGVEIRDE